VKSLQQTAHDDIKSVYGRRHPDQQRDRQAGRGTCEVAVRRERLGGRAVAQREATRDAVLGGDRPKDAAVGDDALRRSLVEQGGSLYQQASFQNNAWHMYGSNLPTLGGITGGTYPTPSGPNTAPGGGVTNIALNINGQPITPEFVTDQSMAAQGSSYGRTQQAANMQVPGLMVA